jgi:F0F1-type ATP synthase epsilon subunit
MSTLTDNTTLTTTIRSPEKTLFDGKAVAVSSISDNGPFDVLAYHSNFICIIKKEITVYETRDKKITFPFEKGILKIYENKADVFLGIETITA